jgi:hypothetical protein
MALKEVAVEEQSAATAAVGEAGAILSLLE